MIKDEYLREYRSKNREKYLEYQKEYRQQNKTYWKQYRQKNKAYWKKYRQYKISNYVYMLLDNADNILYVGSTIDLYSRVLDNKKSKKFDRVVYVEYKNLSRNDTYYIEEKLIEIHKPTLNINNVTCAEVTDRHKLDLLAEEFLYNAKDYR